jgi:hypothetical protein
MTLHSSNLLLPWNLLFVLFLGKTQISVIHQTQKIHGLYFDQRFQVLLCLYPGIA